MHGLGPEDIDCVCGYRGAVAAGLCRHVLCRTAVGTSVSRADADVANLYDGFTFNVLQLRGHAGERQVSGAQVAVVSSGGGIPANCMILTTNR